MSERAEPDHEPSDAEDRVVPPDHPAAPGPPVGDDERAVPLDEPAATEPPLDDDDRDPAVQERRQRRNDT